MWSFAASGTNLFAGTNGGVFRSSNNGKSWTQVNTGLPDTNVSALASSGSYLFAATNDGVFLSTDNGADWRPSNLGLTNVNVEVVFSLVASDNNVFACTNVGLFVSTDNGANWTLVGVPHTYIASLAVSGTNLFAGGNGVYFSTNNGASWSLADSGLINTDVSCMAASDAKVYVLTLYGLYSSTNDGATWAYVDTSLLTSEINTALFTSGHNVFVGAEGSVGAFLSTDDGTTWVPTNFTAPSEILSFAADGGNIFAGGIQGVFLSTDDGRNWTQVDSGNLNLNGVSCLAVSGTNLFAGTGNGVLRSTNSGETWTRMDSGVTNAWINTLATIGANVFAGTQDGVFLSTNGGTSWTNVDSGLTDTCVNTLVVSGRNLIAGTENAGVWIRPLSEMITAVKNEGEKIPSHFALEQNYPNPFNPTTTIRFSLKENSRVTLDIFTVLGQRVQEFNLGQMSAGSYSRDVNMSRFASGVYFYRIDAIAANGVRFISMKKMAEIK